MYVYTYVCMYVCTYVYTQGLAKQQLLQLAVDMFKSAVDRTPNDWVANYEYGCITDTLRGCY